MMRFSRRGASELGDLDKDEWEVDDKGNERDPGRKPIISC